MDTLYDYDGFVALEKVRRAHILLLGCGAVGCNIMLSTLQTGYRRFTLVDYDRVGLHNCVRSAGLFHPKRDVGKLKTAVLAQYATDWDDACETQVINADVRDYGQDFFHKFDAVVCALDNYESVDRVGACMAESGVPLYRAATNEWNSGVEIVRNAKDGACLCCNHERKSDIRVESCGAKSLEDAAAGKAPALEVSSAMAANRLVMAMTRDLDATRREDVRYYDTGDKLYTFRLSRNADCAFHGRAEGNAAELRAERKDLMDARQLKMAESRLFDEEIAMHSLNVPGCVEVMGIGPRPYREYEITVKGESRLKNGAYGNEHVFRMRVPLKYPLCAAPAVFMETPPVAHVNCFADGNICIGKFTPGDTLASVALRTIRVVLLDPATFNYDSKADSASESYCRSLPKNRKLPFPLPAPQWERNPTVAPAANPF